MPNPPPRSAPLSPAHPFIFACAVGAMPLFASRAIFVYTRGKPSGYASPLAEGFARLPTRWESNPHPGVMGEASTSISFRDLSDPSARQNPRRGIIDRT